MAELDPASDVLLEVWGEVQAARYKHAPMSSPHEGSSVIREEFEELWEHVREDTGRSPEARKEAVQLAAMAIRYVLDLCSMTDSPLQDPASAR